MSTRIRAESIPEYDEGYFGEAVIDITGVSGGFPTGILTYGRNDYKVIIEDRCSNCFPGETVLVDVYGGDVQGNLRANLIRSKGCFLERYTEEGATANAVISARNRYDLTGVVSSPYIRKCPGGVDGVVTFIKDCWFRQGKNASIKVNKIGQNRKGQYTLMAEPAGVSNPMGKDPDNVFHVMKAEFGTMHPDKNTLELLNCIPKRLFAAVFMCGYDNYIVSRQMETRIHGDDLARGIELYTNLLSRGGTSHKLVVTNNRRDIQTAKDAISRLGYKIDEVDVLNDF